MVKRHRSITDASILLSNEFGDEVVPALKRASSLNSGKDKKDVTIRLRRDEIMAPTPVQQHEISASPERRKVMRIVKAPYSSSSTT